MPKSHDMQSLMMRSYHKRGSLHRYHHFHHKWFHPRRPMNNPADIMRTAFLSSSSTSHHQFAALKDSTHDELTLPSNQKNKPTTYTATTDIGDDIIHDWNDKFSNPHYAHESKSIPDLLRSIVVFKLCQFPSIVQHADSILHYSKKFGLTIIVNAAIRHTFFKQFCAGEDEMDIRPSVKKLHQHGIGTILDYAAEDDDNDLEKNEDDNSTRNSTRRTAATSTIMNEEQFQDDIIVTNPPFNQPARVYKYQSEQKCDHHVDVFLQCIRAVKTCHESDGSSKSTSSINNSHGFAAIKVTALGNPLLLERLSTAINEANNLFHKFDRDLDGIMTQDEFKSAYTSFFNNGNEETFTALLHELDPDGTDQIDYITFASKLLTPSHLSDLCAYCKNIGPLSLATLSNEELELLSRLHERVNRIAEEASIQGVKLLIDAEHTKYQPAIDYIALDLQRIYNDKAKTDMPIIFNTYQCYLKDAKQRIEIDMERSLTYNYHFGAKLVRGAYMVSERERAKTLNVESPIFSSIEETHSCYDEVVEFLLRRKVETSDFMSLEIMCATHNQNSIVKAIGLVKRLNLSGTRSPSIHFAQLLGMTDNLTYPLGRHGYSVYKYVPYGKIDEVVPYLLRRAQENSDVLGNAANEIALLGCELRCRLLLPFFRHHR